MLVLPHLVMRERNLVPGEDLGHAGVDPPVDHELVRRARLLEMGEMRALHALLPHPDIAGVEGDVEARGAGAEHHHAATLGDETGDREGRLARMLEDDVDILLASDVPDRLAELASFLGPLVVLGRIDRLDKTCLVGEEPEFYRGKKCVIAGGGDSALDWAILLIFFGLTIYDMNKIKIMQQAGFCEGEKLYIYGAMELYLDFINIFLRILSLFAKRRD